MLEQRGSGTPYLPRTPWVFSQVLGLKVGRGPLGARRGPQNLAGGSGAIPQMKQGPTLRDQVQRS